MGRIRAREGIVSFIFQGEFFEVDNNDLMLFIDNFDYSPEEAAFIEEIYSSITENNDSIDQLISSNLKNWTIDRLYRLDLSILRVAVCELLYSKNTPKEIVVNEAVEIAKKFGTDDSSRLINGILGTIIRSNEL